MIAKAQQRIMTGDVRACLHDLPAASVHCVVTSPPYFNKRSYLPAGHPAKVHEIGTEPTLSAYLDKLSEVFQAVRRVLRADGTFWLNIGSSYTARAESGGIKPKDDLLVPHRLAIRLQETGWWVRSDIIWVKNAVMPESVKDRPTQSHEHVLLLTKSDRYFYDAEAVKEPASWTRVNNPAWQTQRAETNDRKGAGNRNGKSGGFAAWQPAQGRNLRNVWTINPTPGASAHGATFPAKLVEPCIKAGTSAGGVCPACGAPWRRLAADSAAWAPSCRCAAGEPIPATVLDPFVGSGTTLFEAARLERSGIGIDLDPACAEMTRSRLARLGSDGEHRR